MTTRLKNLLSSTQIDPTDPDVASLLDDLQCNILKSHGRDFTAHIFFQFPKESDPENSRRIVRDVANHFVISARTQYQQSIEWSQSRIPGGLVGALFLTASGYTSLGFDSDGFSDSDSDQAFRGGMKRRGLDIFGVLLDTANKDPRPDTWEAGYQEDLHGMLLLADDDPGGVRAAIGVAQNLLTSGVQIVLIEEGQALRNLEPQAVGKAEPPRKGQPIEHFGYVDGRSNPLFFQSDIDKEINGDGIDKWDPSAPLELALVQDPFGKNELACGSYFVFRKLEQNVEGFHLGIQELGSQLNISPELAGAMAVGRFKDGTPVTLQGTDGMGDKNNFEYVGSPADDQKGNRCPFHAHIRKVNPRGTTPFTSLENERTRRIVRRGITYGKRDLTAAPPREGVGLLFMCYQANIHHQFEFIQRTWSDNPNFPRNLILPDTGDDPIIGQDSDETASQKWPLAWDSNNRKKRAFGGYVALKGGDYFFAPSMDFLRSL